MFTQNPFGQPSLTNPGLSALSDPALKLIATLCLEHSEHLNARLEELKGDKDVCSLLQERVSLCTSISDGFSNEVKSRECFREPRYAPPQELNRSQSTAKGWTDNPRQMPQPVPPYNPNVTPFRSDASLDVNGLKQGPVGKGKVSNHYDFSIETNVVNFAKYLIMSNSQLFSGQMSPDDIIRALLDCVRTKTEPTRSDVLAIYDQIMRIRTDV